MSIGAIEAESRAGLVRDDEGPGGGANGEIRLAVR